MIVGLLIATMLLPLDSLEIAVMILRTRIRFLLWVSMVFSLVGGLVAIADERPNIVLVMADDQGWGQTEYYNHPILKTPHLNAMADRGLRMDRFYAAAPVCSPTRASVLTGRTNMRTGVESHGYALRRQEKTIAQALQQAGYATAHFGKWHLNGMRGPGVPVLKNDSHHPGKFGFDQWLSVTNFFDRDPIMSRQGEFEEFQGDSSEIIVDEALKFMARKVKDEQPFFAVVWYGTPHSPFRADDADKSAFADLKESTWQHHHGELVAMDRSIGTLRRGLRDLQVAENTIVWFCSDNGGLPRISPDTVGGLRGNKGQVYEGGLRVPCIVEWPAKIKPRVTRFPAVVMDIFPTVAEIVGLDKSAMLKSDGMSLARLFEKEVGVREKLIPFQCFGNTVLLDNDMKLLHVGKGKREKRYELYDLASDPSESKNLMEARPKVAARMKSQMSVLKRSIEASYEGQDYAEGRLLGGDPAPRPWKSVEGYRAFLEGWRERPEYGGWLKGK